MGRIVQKENIITNQALKNKHFFWKTSYYPARKNNCKRWVCREVGEYTNECKNRKNNKLIETLGSLDYFELSEEKTLDLVLNLY